VKLIAVDHPDTIDIFVNERFVPPGPASLTVHQVARPRLPVTATDGDGVDVLPQLREQDDVYVSNLMPTRFQGLCRVRFGHVVSQRLDLPHGCQHQRGDVTVPKRLGDLPLPGGNRCGR
jgi:hypothetical protein